MMLLKSVYPSTLLDKLNSIIKRQGNSWCFSWFSSFLDFHCNTNNVGEIKPCQIITITGCVEDSNGAWQKISKD